MRKLYSLFDRKLLQFGGIVVDVNDFAVQRGLLDAVRASPDSLMSKHPEDFDLYYLGTFDEDLGVLVVEPKKQVVNVAELVTPRLLAKEG